jgi:hypothetical protein
MARTGEGVLEAPRETAAPNDIILRAVAMAILNGPATGTGALDEHAQSMVDCSADPGDCEEESSGVCRDARASVSGHLTP